jgi:hypothetical protein
MMFVLFNPYGIVFVGSDQVLVYTACLWLIVKCEEPLSQLLLLFVWRDGMRTDFWYHGAILLTYWLALRILLDGAVSISESEQIHHLD